MRLPWKRSKSIAPSGSSTPHQLQPDPVSRPERPPEFDRDYVNEEHLAVFARVLNSEDNTEEPPVEHIRSVSDFAPIRERVKKANNSSNKKKRRGDVVREGWAYHVSRWPLLIFIFTLIGLEFLSYVFVRQLVNVLELFSGWSGKMGQLRLKLRRAKTYEEWRATALELDDLLGYTAWKRIPANAYYDSSLVRRVTENLRNMREAGDAEGVSAVLEVCLRSNFAGLENARLFSESYLGTKDRIRDYVEEVERAIEYIRKTSDLSLEEKARLFRYVTKNNGSTALCLSGGASFGYYHFGVVRAMLDANLLPKVITGTSAGALVAAYVCTHTDDELKRTIIPELQEKITACEEPFRIWAIRMYKTGARFDTVQWARKAMFWCNGSTTFKEAYERTGRILNVSVIPYDTHSPTKLLNVHTAPDCLIFTAIIASAAVPGILNPVVLMTKDKNGNVKPWQFQGKHKDGSLRVDIPLQSLHLYFNVTYSIISQVNPHIHLFFFQPRGAPGKPVNHRKGKGWRGGFFLSAAEQFLKLDLTKNFRVIRDLELMPELLGQNWSGVFLQKFEGSVTIWPRSRIKDWFRLLHDPDEAELARMIQVGQQVTWPKLHMIDNRLRIERQIDAGRSECRAAYAQAGRLYNKSRTGLPPGLADSSAVEESDSDIDLGGPEANAPLPDNDETLDETAEEEEEEVVNGSRGAPLAAGVDDQQRADKEDFERRSTRAGSAPASSSAARKRRRQIVSSLGLTSDRPTPSGSPSTLQRRGFDFATASRSALLAPNTDTDGDDGGLDTPGAGRSLGNGRQSEMKLRRRLSTGQLWLGRRSTQTVSPNAFGSGVSEDEHLSGEDMDQERSFGSS